MSRRIVRGAAVVSILALAACAQPVKAPPHAVPAPPTPAVTPPVVGGDWRDVPLTPGGWRYAADADGSTAMFGEAGAPSLFRLRCRRADRTVVLVRAGGVPGAMTVTTSYGPAGLAAVASAGDGAAVTLAAADPLLDRISFSRGRFTVASAGVATLVLPAWAEPARVIEDCRG